MNFIKIALFTLALICLNVNCASTLVNVQASSIDDVPSGIDCNGTVLLCIIEGRRSYDRYMEKQIEKNYFGKYAFVLKEDVKSEKYSDVNKFRYLLDHDPTPRNVSFSTDSYAILDRKEDKLYRSELSSSFFSKLIKAYAIRMETVRNRNCN